jgi:UDP-glucose 4-epimerase
LRYLQENGDSNYFNLGNGNGYSVLEVIESAKRVTSKPIATKMEPRRAGDPSRLIGSNEKARRVLGWNPQHTDLDEIIRSAWNWHESHPNGYGN